jgi:hypothetical protein
MKVLLTLGLSTILAGLASAAVIESGTITGVGYAGDRNFNFGGSGFSASGAFLFGLGAAASCTPCAPGSLLNVNAFVSGLDFIGPGSATVGAMNFAGLSWGDLDVELGGVSIFDITPAITLNAGPGTYHGTFSFTGSLCGTLPSGFIPHPCAVHFPSLSGSGIVDVNITAQSFGGGIILDFADATYTFTSTPEPGTWVLIGIGGAAILSLRRHRSETA